MILPFRKQSKNLISENEFLKYLLLNSPILKGTSIMMIMDSIIYDFYQDDAFQKNFCSAIEYIAKIKDSLEKELAVMENLSPRETRFRASLLRQDFCVEVSQNKIYLKESTLKHFHRFIEFFLKFESAQIEKKKCENIKKEIIEILKTFLKNTYSENIITKVSSLLEMLRGIWKELWSNGRLDCEIEEIIISKSDAYIENHKEELPLNEDEESKFLNNSQAQDDYPSGSMLEEGDAISPKKLKENDEDDDFAKIFEPLIEIEEWLISEKDAVPSIGKNNYIADFFKINGNFEFFLRFVFEPFKIKLNKTWMNEYPFLTDPVDPEHYRCFKKCQMFQTHPLIKKKLPSRFNAYIFRSFKVCEVLADFRNFRLIYSSNPKTLEAFCQYISMIIKSEGFLCEMNHAARLIEVFIKRDPESMLTGLLRNNILKYLLYYLHFPKVFSLLVSLFNVICPKTLITEIHGLKMMKQLINVDFFLEISSMILTGKWALKMVPLRASVVETANHTDITQLKNDVVAEFYPLFEEVLGFNSDIDGIKDLVIAKKKQNLFKATSKKILSLSKMNLIKALVTKTEETPIRRKKSTRPNFEPRFSILSVLSEDQKLKNKEKTEAQPKPESVPLPSYEQFLIRNDADLKYLQWERFQDLYPSSPRLLRENSLDKIAKMPEYSLKELGRKDEECGLAIELICSLVTSCVESKNNDKIANLIGIGKKNSDLILAGLFKQKPDFFNNLMKAFLIKAKVVLVEPYSNIIELGQTINSLLKNLQNTWLESFSTQISQISRKNFIFLQKTIIYSYTWSLGQINIMRLLLIEQFSLIIKNEGDAVLEEILEGVFDTIIKFFVEFKDSNILQRLFLDIVDTVLKSKNHRAVMILILKLNLLNTIQSELLTFLKNEVLTSEFDTDNFFLASKRIFCSLEEVLISDERFPYRFQISSLGSFKALRLRYSKNTKSVSFSSPDTSFQNPQKKPNLLSPINKSKKSLKAINPQEKRQKSSEKKSETTEKSSRFGLSELKLKSANTVFITSSLKQKPSNSPKMANNKDLKKHAKSKTVIMFPSMKN